MTYAEQLDRFRSLRAVVLGDLMLDRYVFGKATRVSPEAPVMVVVEGSRSEVPGGAANVAMNIAALGAEAYLLGIVGQDEAGDALRRELDRLDNLRCWVTTEPGRATTRKTRVVADHAQQVLRIDREDVHTLHRETEDKLLRTLASVLPGAHVLLISDYLKGAVTPRVAREAMTLARQIGIPVVVNPKPRSAMLYAGADLVSLNRLELQEYLEVGVPQEPELAEGLADRARSSLPCRCMLVTLGEAGMAAAWEDGSCAVRAPQVEVYDTAGAGDTVIATVALGVAGHDITPELFRLAAETSARVVRHVGVAVPTESDLADIRALSGTLNVPAYKARWTGP